MEYNDSNSCSANHQHGGLTEFTFQSLSTDETFQIKNALVVSEFANNIRTLPHSVNVEKLEHFRGVTIPVIA